MSVSAIPETGSPKTHQLEEGDKTWGTDCHGCGWSPSQGMIKPSGISWAGYKTPDPQTFSGDFREAGFGETPSTGLCQQTREGSTAHGLALGRTEGPLGKGRAEQSLHCCVGVSNFTQ